LYLRIDSELDLHEEISDIHLTDGALNANKNRALQMLVLEFAFADHGVTVAEFIHTHRHILEELDVGTKKPQKVVLGKHRFLAVFSAEEFPRFT